MFDAYALLGIPDLPPRAFRPRAGGNMALEGGKGGDVPPPDPRLVQAQINSMGIQDNAIQQIMANSNALQPLQMQQMQQAIQAQNVAAQQAQEDRAWTLGRRDELTTAQNQLIDTSNQYNSGAMGLQLGNQALADVNQSFANASGQINRNLGRMGVGPNSGQSSATNASLAAQQALAQATALNKTRAAARQEGIGLNTAVINALSGYPAMATGNATTAAGLGLQGLNAANAGLAGVNSGYGAASTAAGQMGSNATSMYGVQADAYAKDQAAANSAPGAIFGALGTLGGAVLGGPVGAAIGKAITSDRRLKQDIKAVGVDAHTGLTLYEFSYRAHPTKRFAGVMADEVRARYPEAVIRGDDGFDRVDYAALGIEFRELVTE